jgi:hypothetical protein
MASTKSKKVKIRATNKQKIAASIIIGNHGKSLASAMREAGYSPAMVDNPKYLTESVGWQELMKHHLPDELLLKVHKQGLEAVDNRFHEPDYSTRHKYLDSGYKLKGMYAPEKTLNVNIDVEPSADIISLADKLNGV